MKTKQSLGTNYVPAYRSTTGSKLPSFIAYFLPEECKVRTRARNFFLHFICRFKKNPHLCRVQRPSVQKNIEMSNGDFLCTYINENIRLSKSHCKTPYSFMMFCTLGREREDDSLSFYKFHSEMTKRNEIENCMNNSNAAITSANETGNTNYVPAYRSTTGSKLPSFIAYFLPEECKIRTRADFYYVTAIAFICATFFFFPCIAGAIACVVKAKQQKGGI